MIAPPAAGPVRRPPGAARHEGLQQLLGERTVSGDATRVPGGAAGTWDSARSVTEPAKPAKDRDRIVILDADPSGMSSSVPSENGTWTTFMTIEARRTE